MSPLSPACLTPPRTSHPLWYLTQQADGREVAKTIPSQYTVKQVLSILPSYIALKKRIAMLRPVQQITADLATAPPNSLERLQLLYEVGDLHRVLPEQTGPRVP